MQVGFCEINYDGQYPAGCEKLIWITSNLSVGCFFSGKICPIRRFSIRLTKPKLFNEKLSRSGNLSIHSKMQKIQWLVLSKEFWEKLKFLVLALSGILVLSGFGCREQSRKYYHWNVFCHFDSVDWDLGTRNSMGSLGGKWVFQYSITKCNFKTHLTIYQNSYATKH